MIERKRRLSRMVEQTKVPEWILEENAKIEASEQIERLPVLKFEEKKITQFKVDFSNKFEEFPDKFKEGGIRVKIPVEQKGVKMVLFVNKKNPIYWDILRKAKKGVTEFKIIQTGTKKETKYSIVED
jgi:formyltetrahydrofolate hydrolase